MKTYTELKSILSNKISSLSPEAYELNDYLADNPELSGEEFHSCQAIIELLKKHGIPVEESFCGLPTAFKGTIREDPHSPIKIGILTEYDALPEIGHGCGHCASGAISVLAALALHSQKEDLIGSIDLIGTPDEELTGGKIVMCDQGIFDDYSFVIMIHMDCKNRTSVIFNALDPFHFNFTGSPAHAAACPWQGRNALNGAMLTIHAIDMLRQQVQPDTRIHNIILRGGDAHNIIPEYASVECVMRHPDRTYLNEVTRMVKDCARGSALATQTQLEIDPYAQPLDSLKSNPTGTKLLDEIYKEMNIDTSFGNNDSLGSSDIGNVSFRCAAFHPTLAVTDVPTPLHTREFSDLMKSESIYPVITQGAEVISLMIVKALTHPDILDAIVEDFHSKEDKDEKR